MTSATSRTSYGSWGRFGSDFGAALALVSLLAGCRANEGEGTLPPAPSKPTSEALGAGDVIEVRVREQEDLSGMYQVGDAGTIRFPYIGVIEVAGRAPPAIAEEIETRLADGYLRQPQVAVLIRERQNREVSVLGQVQEPGSYPFKERMTLVQAISLAGGMNPLAQRRRIKLIRETKDGRKTFEIDVTAIIDSRVDDLLLEPGDIVFVPESPI